MDDDHASPRDLLDDLTRLSQAGRLRYLKKLSRNDLIEVLSLTLQTKDDGGDMRRNEAFLTRTRTPVLLNEKCGTIKEEESEVVAPKEEHEVAPEDEHEVISEDEHEVMNVDNDSLVPSLKRKRSTSTARKASPRPNTLPLTTDSTKKDASAPRLQRMETKRRQLTRSMAVSSGSLQKTIASSGGSLCAHGRV